MVILKCKMCGGDLVFEAESTVCECEWCGSKQTIPAVDDEKRLKLYERANRLRRNGEFDKAAAVYEGIVADFDQEAEAYWGLVLCKYGIEYVDDPATGRKVPTCHRSSFDSIMEDLDLELALENADLAAKRVYREQAKELEEIRKGIIEVSGKEQPYDIFICYKETDENGDRTLDSVLAQDVYAALTEKGYRVFFSRISLEDKLGVEYEPYIFAALNSARVMLAFGTDYEYYDAVWVKNEWSRFLKMMAKDKNKHLIPCYKGIDAYDIPKEFARLQAQDLGKVGALQDLIRGIDKLMGKGDSQAPADAQSVIQQVVSGGPNVEALLKRGYDALEDRVFEEAKTFFNEALSIDAKAADAYLGIFMAEIKAVDHSAAQALYAAGDHTENRYWKRAKQYATGTLADSLKNWDERRDARLQREAEEDRRAKEEADRKAREAEAARRKEQQEIQSLREQLRTGSFFLTDEEMAEKARLIAAANAAEAAVRTAESEYQLSEEVQEVKRLEERITSMKTKLAGLGFFKGKEKKELQSQIDALANNLGEAKTKASRKMDRIASRKQQAEEGRKRAEEYESKTLERKKHLAREKVFRSYGLDFSKKTVKFGAYEQGRGIDEPIEWLVLERTEKGILLISKYGLDCQPYHNSYRSVTWETCSLRKWLNGTFMDRAFRAEERELIATTTVTADKNPEYSTDPGDDTKDQVFLLSATEVQQYFASEDARKCFPTEYAKKCGAGSSSEGNCLWWLRSPGYGCSYAALVDCGGAVGSLYVCGDSRCARPALWINLSS